MAERAAGNTVLGVARREGWGAYLVTSDLIRSAFLQVPL